MFSVPTNLYLTTGYMILQTVSIAKPPWAVFKLCCLGKGHYQSITGRGGATMKSNHFASENAPSCAKKQSPNISESTSEALGVVLTVVMLSQALGLHYIISTSRVEKELNTYNP